MISARERAALRLLNLPRVDVALVLGSGLGDTFTRLTARRDVPYAQLPGLAAPSAAGHAGILSVGWRQQVPLAIFRGRLHLYEGYTLRQTVQPVVLAAALGAKTVILTNAAGGLNPTLAVGDWVVLTDHLNLPALVGQNPLAGGAHFVAMHAAYDPALREAALAQADSLGLRAFPGTYAMVGGPSYETPAELRFLRLAGADVVGMSTANEAIAARALGLRVLGLSLVTNVADESTAAAHVEVLAAGQMAIAGLERWLDQLLPTLVAGPAR